MPPASKQTNRMRLPLFVAVVFLVVFFFPLDLSLFHLHQKREGFSMSICVHVFRSIRVLKHRWLGGKPGSSILNISRVVVGIKDLAHGGSCSGASQPRDPPPYFDEFYVGSIEEFFFLGRDGVSTILAVYLSAGAVRLPSHQRRFAAGSPRSFKHKVWVN